jgi:hypothetical protein
MDEPAYPRDGRGTRQDGGGRGFVLSFPVSHATMRTVGEMNHDLHAVEMPGPVGVRPNIANWLELQAEDRVYAASRQAQNRMAAPGEFATQCAADETGRAGYQNPCQTPPFGAMMRTGCARDVTVGAFKEYGRI